jgi:hypothetical protein
LRRTDDQVCWLDTPVCFKCSEGGDDGGRGRRPATPRVSHQLRKILQSEAYARGVASARWARAFTAAHSI